MSKDSSLLAYVAGVATGVLVAALARTEEGRRIRDKIADLLVREDDVEDEGTVEEETTESECEECPEKA